MRIGEVAAAAGTTAKALRFYEGQGLLPAPARSHNGYRDYPDTIVSRVQFIRRGQAASLSLKQIRDILRLRDAGQTPCAHVRDLLAAELNELDKQIAELLLVRATVAEIRRNAEEAGPGACDADEICSLL